MEGSCFIKVILETLERLSVKLPLKCLAKTASETRVQNNVSQFTNCEPFGDIYESILLIS